MGSSNQLPFRFKMVYASNATVGEGNRNRVLVLSECRWHRLSAQLHRDTETGMFTATLTAPVNGNKKVLIGAYGTNNAILAFNAYVRFEQQALLSAAAPLVTGAMLAINKV